MDKTSLGDRMKTYEAVCEQTFMKRVPIIVRCDGKGFSRWTKKMKFERPFDKELAASMQQAMFCTAQRIEGCVFGYTQSDEITFVLRNDQSLESEPWFGNRLQKIVSVVASMVTASFNDWWVGREPEPVGYAYFDARAFTVPSLDEAANALVWRQNDATKNSVSTATYYEVGKVLGKGTARAKMHGLDGKKQQELLFQEAKINWNDYDTFLKRGSACYRTEVEVDTPDGTTIRNKWKVDKDIPIFTKDREWLMTKLGS